MNHEWQKIDQRTASTHDILDHIGCCEASVNRFRAEKWDERVSDAREPAPEL